MANFQILSRFYGFGNLFGRLGKLTCNLAKLDHPLLTSQL
jgi:hypothetical protein